MFGKSKVNFTEKLFMSIETAVRTAFIWKFIFAGIEF